MRRTPLLTAGRVFSPGRPAPTECPLSMTKLPLRNKRRQVMSMLTLKVEGPAGLKVVEVWFPRDGDTVRLPGRIPRFVRLFHLERPVQGLLGWWQRRQTLVTDLSTIDDLDKRLS